MGATTKTTLFATLGTIVSLAINFKASAIGCKIPHLPTTLGPRLRCIAPKTLRSNNVNKAITKITGTIIKKACNTLKFNPKIKLIIFTLILKIINNPTMLIYYSY